MPKNPVNDSKTTEDARAKPPSSEAQQAEPRLGRGRLDGEVDAILFMGRGNYAVAAVIDTHGERQVAVGGLAHLLPGMRVRILGRWLDHPKHGLQILVRTCEAEDRDSYRERRLATNNADIPF